MEPIEHTWTLITVTYNSAADLAKSWDGISLPAGVTWVVVDNASTDNSRAVAAKLGAQVIPLSKNVGFSRANNLGFAQTDSQFVGFINPDVKVNLADLPKLANILLTQPQSLVAPQLVNPDGSLQPNGRGQPCLASKVRHLLSSTVAHDGYQIFATPGELKQVEWLMGAVVLGQRSWLAQLGPWDDRYFVYYEDSDLGVRNSLAGGCNLLLGAGLWEHSWARATKAADAKAWGHELKSGFKFYRRYPRLLLSNGTRQPAKSGVAKKGAARW